MTGRFAISRHDGPRGLHWDLFIEVGSALRTWALPQQPELDAHMIASALPDHRPEYLDYQGPVSGGRGAVERWDWGWYRAERATETEWLLMLDGCRLRARLVLIALAGRPGQWHARFERPQP